VVFSDTYISELDAQLLVDSVGSSQAGYAASFTTTTDRVGQVRVSHAAEPPAPSSDPVDGSSSPPPTASSDDGEKVTDGTSQVSETYEILHLPNSASPSSRYLCAIPVLAPPEPLNTTANELAKAEEARELSRAQARGWELMSGLDGSCLYFVSGWWSYSFCYNRDIVQFHALPNQLDRHGLPVRDPDTQDYVLGKVAPQIQKQLNGQRKDAVGADEKPSDADLGQESQTRPDAGDAATRPSSSSTLSPPNTEVAVKGDQRYLVQRLDGGTICDLTGRERTIEVQYHCLPNAQADRIGWIKEVTTCTYLMVINTPRLCQDVAFLPPKETRAHPISCRSIVSSDEDIEEWHRRKAAEALEIMGVNPATGNPLKQGGKGKGSKGSAHTYSQYQGINIGGIVVGGRQSILTNDANEPINPLPVPRGYVAGQRPGAPLVEVLVSSASKAEGGEIQVLTDEELEKMALDPAVVEELWKKLQEMAGDNGWKLEMVEIPGQMAEIRGIIDNEDGDEDGEGVPAAAKGAKGPKGNSGKQTTGKEKFGKGQSGGKTNKKPKKKVVQDDDDGNDEGSQERFFKEEL
jgi:protein OS-9